MKHRHKMEEHVTGYDFCVKCGMTASDIYENKLRDALKELRKIGQMENNPHILKVIDRVLK